MQAIAMVEVWDDSVNSLDVKAVHVIDCCKVPGICSYGSHFRRQVYSMMMMDGVFKVRVRV